MPGHVNLLYSEPSRLATPFFPAFNPEERRTTRTSIPRCAGVIYVNVSFPWEGGGWERTYRTGVGYYVCDVLRGVDRVGAVRAFLRDVGESGYDKREALAVDDVPVERIDLHIHARQAHAHPANTF